MDLAQLTVAVRQFAEERDWQQFHTPKNLAISVAIEAGELLELVQWRTDGEVTAALTEDGFRSALGDEIADVLIYLVRLADVSGIELTEAVGRKLSTNAARYTVEGSRGSAEKRPRT